MQLIFIIKKTNMKSLKELELSVPSLDLSSSKNLMGGDGYSGHWEYEDGTPITSNTVEDHNHGDPIYVVDLPDVVVIGEKPGRENGEEFILYVPIGVGTEDVAVGKKIYELAKEKGKWEIE